MGQIVEIFAVNTDLTSGEIMLSREREETIRVVSFSFSR